MQSDDLGLVARLRCGVQENAPYSTVAGWNIGGADYLMQEAAAAIERLEANEKELRRIISECATALPNGAFLSPEASIEFMANLPSEIKACSERLVAERDEARVDHEHFVAENEINKGRVEADEAERDKLKAALKPFADAAESIDDTVPDRAEMWEAPAAMETTAGDFRRARQALKDAP